MPNALLLSFFERTTDQSAWPEARSWNEWLPVLTRHEQRAEKDGPCVVLGSLPAGAERKGANVRSIHALGLDVEHRTEQEIAAGLAPLAPFEYALATTHTHGTPAADADPARRTRLRVILPLARSISPKRHKEAWAALHALTNGIGDPATKDLARLFFLPSAPDLSTAWSYHNATGRFLALSDLGAEAPDEPTDDAPEQGSDRADGAKRIRSLLKRMPTKETADDGRDLKELARRVLAGEAIAESGDRHNAILALTIWLAYRLLDKPLPTESVLDVLADSLKAAAFDPQDAANA